MRKEILLNQKSKNQIPKLYATLLVFMLFVYTKSQAQLKYSIQTTTPAWNLTLPTLTTAGSNYSAETEYETASDFIKLNVEIFILLGNVRVSVYRQDSSPWPPELELSIRRTGNGSTLCILCSINGGSAYTSLTNSSQNFFNITSVASLFKYSNIPAQLKLKGTSVTMSGRDYQTTIVYTIAD